MDFIRWIILGWESSLFGDGQIFPLLGLTIILTAVSYSIHVAVGITVTSIALVIWGLIAYVFISREVKLFYSQYQKSKDNESGTS